MCDVAFHSYPSLYVCCFLGHISRTLCDGFWFGFHLFVAWTTLLLTARRKISMFINNKVKPYCSDLRIIEIAVMFSSANVPLIRWFDRVGQAVPGLIFVPVLYYSSFFALGGTALPFLPISATHSYGALTWKKNREKNDPTIDFLLRSVHTIKLNSLTSWIFCLSFPFYVNTLILHTCLTTHQLSNTVLKLNMLMLVTSASFPSSNNDFAGCHSPLQTSRLGRGWLEPRSTPAVKTPQEWLDRFPPPPHSFAPLTARCNFSHRRLYL